MRLTAYIDGVGILGPGLEDWPHAAAVLRGGGRYAAACTVLPAPALLPPAERRRTGRVVKLALAVALEATQRAGVEPARLASVFTSSGGDGHNCHELCAALAAAPREVSPTRFANSVHNAAAGYWSIATGATLESTVLCAHDASFGAGLLEAMTHTIVHERALLLVAYDTDYPQPLRAKRPVPDAFGVALVLLPVRTANSVARIEVMLGDAPPAALASPELEALRASIPAARCLPLLERLATGTAGSTVLEYLDVSQLVVNLEPCA